MMCCESRKTLFTFENGTRVRARNRTKAERLLKDVALANGPTRIESTGLDVWRVSFGPDVFIDVETPTEPQALMTAEWLLYLDRRSHKP